MVGAGLAGGGLGEIERAVGAAVRVASVPPVSVVTLVAALPGTSSGMV
ncbi:hypothetical protein [Sphingomonas palmae]|nr:hypothetical protein [Sphingomonas palmae]